MGTKPITDATFASEVLQSDVPVVVDFWAEWCAPCKKIAPLLDEIEAEMAGRLKIVSLNIDENPNTTREQGILSAPTLKIFKGGEPVFEIVGAKPKSELVKRFEAAI
ncbi:MAG TPA: thioredoxin [Micromonosporaceae bacterium]|nr:thioredoxin [Micromonosporaceae bacterium]